jgi:hypothetical protein
VATGNDGGRAHGLFVGSSVAFVLLALVAAVAHFLLQKEMTWNSYGFEGNRELYSQRAALGVWALVAVLALVAGGLRSVGRRLVRGQEIVVVAGALLGIVASGYAATCFYMVGFCMLVAVVLYAIPVAAAAMVVIFGCIEEWRKR